VVSYYGEHLDEIRRRELFRKLRPIHPAPGPVVYVDHREVVCFSSNDYLGLAGDPRIIEAVASAVRQWGWGAAASRLITGTMEPHLRLERRLAEFKGTEASLVVPTGYMANLAAVRAGAGPGDHIFSDALNHASIVDAARLSGATIRVYSHRNYDHLERLLQGAPETGRRLIVTDSLFSMDGDLADLPRLVEIRRRYGADLCVDEAHATGLYGREGRGIAEMMGVERDIDITVGTLSKALGGMGGFISGAQVLIDYLVNTARAFIYTTAVPPSVCAAAEKALDIVRDEPERRQHVAQLAARLREGLASLGLNAGTSVSHIVPVIVGETHGAVELAGKLLERGFLAWPIRPPSVPEGTSRLRISVTAGHTTQHIDALVAALAELAGTTR
jgi:8-amino-7-oxononanoate synthase